ncbi:MAG: type II/IV secretion system protein [Kiritimatiellae bacterium]|nr:type II/IV secretion system protein [Kiritimatiellia bacterium]
MSDTQDTDTAQAQAPTTIPEPRFYGEDMVQEVIARLLTDGSLSEDQLVELQNRASLSLKPVDELALEEGLVDEPTFLALYSELSNIPLRKIGDYKIGREVIDSLPARVALRYRVAPVQLQDGVLTLAACRVPAFTVVEGLRVVLDRPVQWVLCPSADVNRSLTYFYGLGAETVEKLVAEAPPDDEEEKEEDIAAVSDDSGMIQFINMIIAEAIHMDATDIHIEPFEDKLRLRCRVDGILQEIPLPKGVERLKRSISSAVKIMGNMDISERRKPHDGRIKVRCDGNEYDLRVSILPTAWGETCCLRILNRNTVFADLDKLGLSQNQLPKIRQLADLPHGVILLTGPTGSGKTTTLYALLSRLNKTGVKIITVEDPIEYQMQGVSQVQVHSKIGLTFASVLRSILRHDPDVILIGEIRDTETADIAVRSSLTGHLVLSTLHTNDAPSAVTRLTDMGIEPYLIASCVEGVIAQRLVRSVCTQCKHETDVDQAIRDEIAGYYPDLIGNAHFALGNGCPNCGFTGYRGRSAINEVMVMSDQIRSLVVQRAAANVIKDTAVAEGMVTLRRDGWLRVVEGRTSVDEVMRVVGRSS